MDERLIGVHVRAFDAEGHYRTWSGRAWLDLEGRPQPSALMEVSSDFLRWLTAAHSVTIHLLPAPRNRDNRPALDAEA